MMNRALFCLFLAAPLGVLLNWRYGFNGEDPVLAMIGLQRPDIYFWAYASWTAMMFMTPWILMRAVLSTGWTMSLRLPTAKPKAGKLPKVLEPEKRQSLEVVVGELHHQREREPSPTPQWLTIPARGLHTGVMVIGATGSGKTTGCLYPFARQVLAYRADQEFMKPGGLVLEVKGDFCKHIEGIMKEYGRGKDYIAMSMSGEYRYNPLVTDRSAYETAYSIATLMNQLYGKGKDSFWQLAYSHLITNVITLFQCVNGYVTLRDVYRGCCHKELLKDMIDSALVRMKGEKLVISKSDFVSAPAGMLDHLDWEDYPLAQDKVCIPFSGEMEDVLDNKDIPYHVSETPNPRLNEPKTRRALMAVFQWFTREWLTMDPKLHTSIIEGISPFLQIFELDSDISYIFCPPKEAYDPVENASGFYGKVLPPMARLMEEGKVLALDFPAAAYPGLARLIGTMMKQEFQRAMLLRIPRISAQPWKSWRSCMFLCDEYHEFITCGGSDPAGDDRFFPLSRGARCIPIVATQSVSSLRSTLHGDVDWQTLTQCFRTKIFLGVSDEYTASWASKLCGREDRMKVTYALNETGSDTRVSMMSGRTVSGKTSLGASKSYSTQKDVVFEPKVFLGLRLHQSVTMAFDGDEPLPAQFCYMRPFYWGDDRKSWFTHAQEGTL